MLHWVTLAGDVDDQAVSAASVDEVIDALTEAVVEVLTEEIERIRQTALRWSAQTDNADCADALAYAGTTSQDEAIINGVREAGYQAMIDDQKADRAARTSTGRSI